MHCSVPFPSLGVLACVLVISPILCSGLNYNIARWKRQACSSSQFQCESGECIPQFLLCDGEVNCKDGSDEVSKVCKKTLCPSYAFTCDYGGCVDADSKCNGKRECADGSDEKGCESGNVQGQNSCQGKFKCDSGICIDPLLLCDGTKDCDDGSDETETACKVFTCPGFAFQCDYGACIDSDGRCNGVKQCADGSDEKECGTTAPTTTTTTVAPSSSGCVLPPQPENGHYTLSGCSPPCQPVPGNHVQQAFITYTCNSGFHLTGDKFVECNRSWKSSIPTCSKVTCKPIADPSRDIKCKRENRDVDCDKPMAPGTTASVTCDTYYSHGPEFSNFNTVCQPSGKWSRDVTPCIPKCGEPNPEGVPFVANGRQAKLGEYPWHAGIYKPDNEVIVQVCGGSIISERVIATASHCFWDDASGQMFDYRDFQIAVGKHYRDWNTAQNESKYIQRPEILEVILHNNFRGMRRNYADDIGLIIVKQRIKMTIAVRPICVDYEKKYNNFFTPGKRGIVVGWGITQNMNQSDVLHTATLPYVDFTVCEKEVPDTFQAFLTSDKFCAGYQNGTSVCPGDSGGGYATQFKDGKYYLMGIVSVGVPAANADACNIYQYTTFTKVFDHYDFVLRESRQK